MFVRSISTVIVLTFTPSLLGQGFVETFDNGEAGWFVSTDMLSRVAAIGNPAPGLDCNCAGPPLQCDEMAISSRGIDGVLNPAFQGDWRAKGIRSIGFDIRERDVQLNTGELEIYILGDMGTPSTCP